VGLNQSYCGVIERKSGLLMKIIFLTFLVNNVNLARNIFNANQLFTLIKLTRKKIETDGVWNNKI
jgi:hypothetical protein